ncbi:hypothetical protein PybrP1_003602 [[Pythium] brassicae (nom. inval.)]|nr:hypothetical protein PybrP1_003602 [[Pythium] brassicae (nom. inval.)]
MSREQVLDGRVFARHRAFLRLPELEQRRTQALATFIDQSAVFHAHRGFLHRSSAGISCDALFDLVLGYLEKHPELIESRVASAAASDAASGDSASVSVVVATQRKKQVAWTFVDRLVQSNFLMINDEGDDPMLGMKLDDFARPGMLFVPTHAGPSAAGAPVSVWSLREDAVRAGVLRRANAITKSVGGRDAYFVLDGKRKTLYWFASDASTAPKGSIELSGAQVQSCGPHMVDATGFCVKITTRHDSLLLVGSAAADWINPLIACGAVYNMTLLEPILSVVTMVIGEPAVKRSMGFTVGATALLS